MTPPSLSEPEATPYMAEYKLYRDGTRDANGKNVDPAGNQIRQGFGLTQPDDDKTAASGVARHPHRVKPAMTVIYAPANDMLHAFRAGPNCSPAFTSYSPSLRTPPASRRAARSCGASYRTTSSKPSASARPTSRRDGRTTCSCSAAGSALPTCSCPAR